MAKIQTPVCEWVPLSDIQVPEDYIRPSAPDEVVGDDFDDLRTSIETHKMLQPLVVDDKGFLRSGRRRLRVLESLGRSEALCIRLEEGADVKAVEIALNTTFREVHVLDQARAAWEYYKASGLSQTEAGARIGIKQPKLCRLGKIHNLPSDLKEYIWSEQISATAVSELAMCGDEQHLARLRSRLKAGETISVNDIRRKWDSGALDAEDLPVGLRATTTPSSLNLQAQIVVKKGQTLTDDDRPSWLDQKFWPGIMRAHRKASGKLTG